MKYKIIKRMFYSHQQNKENKLYELIETEKYGTLRKGKIFGFWHEVGEWMCDSQGNKFCFEEWFDSREQCESYLQCWHVENYGKKEPLDIID